MSNIREKNTKPEMVIRRGLHALGFRYRLHDRRLPAKPDLVLRKYHAAIFVNGCFWHGHDCALFKWPSTRSEWWRAKIERTRERDVETITALCEGGWRVLEIWECSMKGPGKLPLGEPIERAASWLRSREERGTIRGTV